MKSFTIFLLGALLSACAHAQTSGILRGSDLQRLELREALRDLTPGSILIIGENHGFQVHQQQQVEIMATLRSLGHKVSVGMEFFTYTDQPHVNNYLSGQLSEEAFLKAISWGGLSFDFYREQTLFPDGREGSQTLALNAPRSITGKVAKGGLEALTEEDRRLLPPQFTLGRDSYKERFLKMMPHIPSPEAGLRYFMAQSIWDDTMAWQASEFIARHPDQTLVIVVGEFHVQYGGGLPDRLRARSAVPLLTVSQINTAGLSADEIAKEVQASEQEGPRADLLWLAPAESPGQ